ncbi:MAG: hypothetical protein ABIA62_03200 [Candidatus Woesearchaeota archaeon]
MFCPKCKTILKRKKHENSVVMACESCGFEKDAAGMKNIKDPKVKPDGKKFGVAEENYVLAVHNHTCSKCGHDKAELIEQGVWYTDEDHVVLYRCGKCGSTEREDAKVK